MSILAVNTVKKKKKLFKVNIKYTNDTISNKIHWLLKAVIPKQILNVSHRL